jgi:hypothetical protein
VKATEQDFLRQILTLIVEHTGATLKTIATELRAQGKIFTDEELELACQYLREAGYTERAPFLSGSH